MTDTSAVDLSVQLGRLTLPNPVMVASGTFGYAREMEFLVELGRLGGIIPKTITPQPRAGNQPLDQSIHTRGAAAGSSRLLS